MNRERIIFINSNQAKSGFLSGSELPRDYVLTCRFLGCGIIDRTCTLDQGFDYAVLDPIPKPSQYLSTAFAELCDSVAMEIVSDALKRDKIIQVLWSGGIDSTASLIAIMKAAEKIEQRNRIRILLSIDSIHEYTYFYQNYITGNYQTKPISPPISRFLVPEFINVTGEHGDQLFGSYLLKQYVQGGSAHINYQDVLPLVLMQHFGGTKKVERVMRYLEPQIAAAPVPIRTLFDCMWWLNYSLKWQQVTLRLPVFREEEVRESYESIRHFYRDERFQVWSLANPSIRSTPPVWELYKETAKQYIFAFTGDIDYYRNKTKELSLKTVMVNPTVKKEHRFQVFMREDFCPIFKVVDRNC